ncbi:MAG: MFS transporter [Anaerolineales bacterium]|nr:MFS transporter [Anaerolineales bacterium]MDW8226938.1 MFS transporter [Anaerolineales bacterium]
MSSFFARHFPALTSRNFLIFWVGQFISLIGSWMQSTTLPYLAYRLSGRPFDLGLIGFSTTLPTLVLALPGGVLVERLEKRKIVIVLQTVMMFQAFGLAALTFGGLIQIWHLVVLSFLLGCATAVEITARQSMLVEMVGKQALPNAIALQAMIFNLARVLGPSLTAAVLLLVEHGGEGWAFFLNGVSFLFVIVGLMFVRTPYQAERLPHQNNRMGAEFREGLRYISGNALVTAILLLAALIGFFGFPFVQQIPALARDVLSVPNDTEALIKARTSLLYLAQGCGALAAALFLSVFSQMRRKGLFLTAGQFLFAAGLVLISFTRTLAAAIPLIIILGWGLVSQMATMNTLIQVEVPDRLRGRVFSVYLWAVQGVAPLGSLFIGGLAQLQGVPRAALVAGGICLLAASLIHARYPILRQKTV